MICLDGELAATLEASGERMRLDYEESWLAGSGSYPLSQSLPLQPGSITGAPVRNFLWGLLPDNERTLDVWARRFHVSARNPAALLAHVGEDCAGAVQFVREERMDDVLASGSKPEEIAWLDEVELERRIRHLTQDAGAARENVMEGQFSLSGARAKTALHFDPRRKRWGIPRGRIPTTHILKPASGDYDGLAENEHFCLSLAARVGLAAASTEWLSIGGIPTVVAERYDRIQINRRWRRIHQEDCCQALAVHPGSKHENEGGPGFARIMTLLEGTDEPGLDRDRLMKTACLVYLLAATDAHAKNFSLLYSRGSHRPSMRLAPLYDIASAWPYPRGIPVQKMKLAMQVGRHYRQREIQPRHFEDLARACRYPADRLIAALQDLAERLPDESGGLLKEIEVRGMARAVLARLHDGLAVQCGATQRLIAKGVSGA